MADADSQVYRWVVGDTAIEVSGIKLRGQIITSAYLENMAEGEREILLNGMRQAGAPIRRVPWEDFERITSGLERK